MKRNKIYEEFLIWSLDDRPGIEKITLCGLCGNSGIIDTTKSADHYAKMVGVVGYCICPNGRQRKRVFAKNSSHSIITTKADGGAYIEEKIK